MREIKFRAWNVEEGKMVYLGDGFHLHLGITAWTIASREKDRWEVASCGDFDKPECDSDILMQFTGLVDKNGVEIYEGDIVKEVGECGILGVVEYVAPKFKVAYKYEDSKSFWEDEEGNWVYDKITEFISLAKNLWEVLGNIYENPKLLGVDK